MQDVPPKSPVPPWRPPGRSLTTRDVHGRSSAACRPSVTGGREPREIMCESELERKVAFVLLTHPQVVGLREQPPAIAYRDAAGVVHRHTFDFLVTLADGRKLAVAVKPMARAVGKRLRETCELMAGQLPPGFADGILLLTEADVPRDAVHNAALLHQCRHRADPAHDTVVGSLLREPGQATIRQLVEASGLGGAGFRAVVRPIAMGVVRRVADTRIDQDTLLAWDGRDEKEAT